MRGLFLPVGRSTPARVGNWSTSVSLNRQSQACTVRGSGRERDGLHCPATDGIEQTFTVEQAATTVHWERSGQFEQRVVGYRSQSVGVTISAVGLFRQAWVVPILYGNRMTLLFGEQDSTRRNSPGQRRRANAVVAVHPFAEERDRLYRFSGGDTS